MRELNFNDVILIAIPESEEGILARFLDRHKYYKLNTVEIGFFCLSFFLSIVFFCRLGCEINWTKKTDYDCNMFLTFNRLHSRNCTESCLARNM